MKRKTFAYPYVLWLCLFILAPMLLIAVYAFTDSSGAFSVQNLIRAVEPIYLGVLGRSLYLALISTVICLILGYPMAYILANKVKRKGMAMIFIMIPMWMNFLLRTYAWMAILDVNGIINTFLQTVGLPKVQMLYTNGAIVLGMVYNFLPFMILPIYSVLVKMPQDYIEAAEDLGADRRTVFSRIIFPLSLPGVISGITMVFMPAVSTFAISRLLGGSKIMLLGDLIENQFMLVQDWHFGSTLSLIMLVMILISMALLHRKENMEEGSVLW